MSHGTTEMVLFVVNGLPGRCSCAKELKLMIMNEALGPVKIVTVVKGAPSQPERIEKSEAGFHRKAVHKLSIQDLLQGLRQFSTRAQTGLTLG